MNDTNNQFIDDDGLTKFTSLTHLLNDDNNTDTCDIELVKHSQYFSETEFQKLQFKNDRLGIMSLNCQSINAKFDELQLFINRFSKVEEIRVVCLQETWTSENDDISLFQLPSYKLFHKGKKCCNHDIHLCMCMNNLTWNRCILHLLVLNGKDFVLKYHNPNHM